MAYVALLWGIFLIIFAVIGTGMLGGLLYQCSYDTGVNAGMMGCSGVTVDLSRGVLMPLAWFSPTYNFDSVPTAMLTLFRMTYTKYVDILSDVLEFSSDDTRLIHVLYFMIFILLAGFFVMNVFVA